MARRKGLKNLSLLDVAAFGVKLVGAAYKDGRTAYLREQARLAREAELGLKLKRQEAQRIERERLREEKERAKNAKAMLRETQREHRGCIKAEQEASNARMEARQARRMELIESYIALGLKKEDC